MKQFSSAQAWVGALDGESTARLIAATSDIALVLDRGVIRDVSFGSEELARELDGVPLLGQAWAETVTVESRPKVDALLRDAAARAVPRWRQLNQTIEGRDGLPVLYAAVPAGGTPGDSGPIVVVGRSLQPISTLQQRLLDAQQAVDREHARQRQVETRHRLLFQLSTEPVLVVDANTQAVVEANPAAERVLAQGHALANRPFLSCFDPASRAAVDLLAAHVRATGRPEDALARAVEGGQEHRVSVALFRERQHSFFLVRLAPAGAVQPLPEPKSRVLALIERGPDGFLVTDPEGRINYANRAFLDMAQLATPEQTRGESLDRWLGRSGVDLNLLTVHLREHGAIRNFATTLRGEYGASTQVEICAVAVLEGADPCLGFSLRDVAPRLPVDDRTRRERPRSVEQLTELVGRVPLKDLVRESSDVIERLCIEAALELTNDNRASAAEILGLSRQSLYAKLRRYGLGDLDAGSAAGDGAEPGASERGPRAGD